MWCVLGVRCVDTRTTQNIAIYTNAVRKNVTSEQCTLYCFVRAVVLVVIMKDQQFISFDLDFSDDVYFYHEIYLRTES